MVILIAGIDLSVGSVVGLSAVVCTLMMQYGVPTVLRVPITLDCRRRHRTVERLLDRKVQHSTVHHNAGHADDRDVAWP